MLCQSGVTYKESTPYLSECQSLRISQITKMSTDREVKKIFFCDQCPSGFVEKKISINT